MRLRVLNPAHLCRLKEDLTVTFLAGVAYTEWLSRLRLASNRSNTAAIR